MQETYIAPVSQLFRGVEQCPAYMGDEECGSGISA